MLGIADPEASVGTITEFFELEWGVFEIVRMISGHHHLVGHLRTRQNHIDIKLSIKSFFHDLHMQKPQKPTTKSVSESGGDFVFVCERTIRHFEFLDIGFQLIVVLSIDGIDACEDIRSDFLKTGNRSLEFLRSGKYSVSDSSFLQSLNPRDDIANLSCFQGGQWMIFWLETTDFEDVDDSICTHESDAIASFDLS